MHPMKRALRHFVLLAALMALVLPASAAATSPMTIVRDCADSDSLEGSYSNSDLQKALKLVRGDLAEYSNCKAVISAAKGGGPKAMASGKGGPIDPDLNNDGVVTPRERRIAAKRAREQRREDRELAVIGDSLSPDGDSSASGSGGSSGGGSLPMILTLVALALLAVGGGLWYTAKRNPAVANALRRVPLPGKHS
jgi:hypothetical protein